jgi:hypothetical protein
MSFRHSSDGGQSRAATLFDRAAVTLWREISGTRCRRLTLRSATGFSQREKCRHLALFHF